MLWRICIKAFKTLDSTEISGPETLCLKGDLYLWIRLLIPGVVKRVYNMQNKQMVKIFSRYKITKIT